MPRVLIVDDHAGYRQRLVDAARSQGFDVVGESTTGEEAVTLYAREEPDLVIIDLHLPGEVDGFETAHVMQQISDKPRLVACSSFTDPGELTRAFDSGFHRCLRKPFRSDEAERLFENMAEDLGAKVIAGTT